MIHEKLFTQGRIIDVKGEKTQFYFRPLLNFSSYRAHKVKGLSSLSQ